MTYLYRRQFDEVAALKGKCVVMDLHFENGSIQRSIRGKIAGAGATGFIVMPSGMDSVAWPTSVQYSQVHHIVEDWQS